MKSASPQAILHDLESFRQMGSVLYIAAHPDDENTELLAYLSRGRHYRTAYLSLTRGDGGQNLLGPDLGAKLGVARTQELLAARHIDGARQFFSRAVDFGFSKSYRETLGIWEKQAVLSDIVRVIRQFRPDVVITRFSPSPGGTHGHHTASAILAVEAFELAGDAKAFPEQKLPPWQPRRIIWNLSRFQKDKVEKKPILKIETGGKDAASGQSFYEIASASRSMHKTQGFDQFRLPGGNGEKREESFQLLAGAAAAGDIMDGVDTTWSRVPGGTEIGASADRIIAGFDRAEPVKSVPALLQLRSRLKALAANDSGGGADSLAPVISDKQALLDRILQECLGLTVETTTAHADLVAGESLELRTVVSLSADLPADAHSSLSVKWLSESYPLLGKSLARDVELVPGKPAAFESTVTLPAATPLTQPYWLREEGSRGLFKVADSSLIGTADNAPFFSIEERFQIDGQTLVVHDQPVQISAAQNGHQIRRPLDVIPPVSLHFTSDVLVMRPGASKPVDVEVKAWRAQAQGTVEIEAPRQWRVTPARQSFKLDKAGERSLCRFTVTAAAQSETAKLTAGADIGGVRYHGELVEVDYPHIPKQLMQPPAQLKVVSLALSTRGHKIGYLPGAGDSLPENLTQMGYEVKTLALAPDKLTAGDLQGLDAVVLGVRAFNVRKNLAGELPVLFDYVRDGGTMIVQYNRPDHMHAEKIAPYELHIARDRVTDESAEVTFLDAESPVLNHPNKITKADFDGWVQERGLYFAGSWDDHFKPILSLHDQGEPPSQGALLIASYGKGYYIYTGLGFFRQLPAGVPGAYRLFANLLSIGK